MPEQPAVEIGNGNDGDPYNTKNRPSMAGAVELERLTLRAGSSFATPPTDHEGDKTHPAHSHERAAIEPGSGTVLK